MTFDVVQSLHSWILHSIAADMIEIRKENMRVITDVKVYLMNIRVRPSNVYSSAKVLQISIILTILSELYKGKVGETLNE